MEKILLLALAFGIASALPVAPVIPGGAITTSHHQTTTAAHHHGIGYPTMGYYPTAAIHPYGGYGGYSAFPGLGGLGYGYAYGGFPAAKAITTQQVSTTAVGPGYYGYY